MADHDSRLPLAPSLSLSAISSVVAERPLKRTLSSTSDLEFFTSAASSFNPRPYTPSANPTPAAPPKSRFSHLTRNLNKLEPHALPSVGMDPCVTDPNAIFIHPPYTSFPGVENHPEGLTYNLMAENAEWFLDPADYISVEDTSGSSDAQRVPYPSYLEPPRGWCPAKKKNLKELGSEGWPEGEEPRLRCTFCRRTYAGVNAKSMWRRHVFEKHKIAMSNRRDGGDRPRGRGSMSKENKPVVTKSALYKNGDTKHDSIVNIDVAPQPFFRNSSHKSRFRSTVAVEPVESQDDLPVPSAPQIPQVEFSTQSEDIAALRATLPPLTPPLTPYKTSSSDPVSASDEPQPNSPPVMPIVPPSPYDPRATPSFRHSPAPLPSDQPWRYPSPSHPFSRARDLSLSLLVPRLRATGSGALSVTDSPVAALLKDNQCSPGISLTGKKPSAELETPESLAKSQGRGFLPRSLNSILHNSHTLLNDSPLGRGLTSHTHRRNFSEISDDWLTIPIRDPFLTSYNSWENEVGGQLAEPNMNPTESPVIRRDMLSKGVGLGIGLLEPFILPDDSFSTSGGSSSHESSSQSETEDEVEIAAVLTTCPTTIESTPFESTPPPKKRRISESRATAT